MPRGQRKAKYITLQILLLMSENAPDIMSVSLIGLGQVATGEKVRMEPWEKKRGETLL